MKKKVNQVNISSDYLYPVFDPTQFPGTVNKMVTKIKSFQKKHKIDAIAFTGTSGSAVAYPLSYKLKIPLICIRKEKTNHTHYKYEGRYNASTYIIVDDFISTGATIKTIKKQVREISRQSKLLGIFLYNASMFDPGHSYKDFNTTIYCV